MAFIVLASANAHKVKEYRELLKGQNVEIKSLLDYPQMAPVEETGKTFEENASLKAVAASKFCDAPAFADDSGLVINALDGAPGIYSARYAATPEERIARVLKELEGKNDRSAKFVCVIALALNGEVIECFRGEVKGKIIDAPRGQGGFGYDPIFVPEGCTQTFSEMPEAEKNKISHRARAFAGAIEFVEDQLAAFGDSF